MPIDYKTAKHICNVIRRQVQNGFPDLYINFVIHKEDERKAVFLKEAKKIAEHPAGTDIVKHIRNNDDNIILEKNRSCFTAIAHSNKPGFLGYFKNESYLALCFLNYERFTNEENLRNHALHMTWHAIALYIDSKKEGTCDNFKFENNILTSTLTNKELHHRNLMADIFSATLQTLRGRENALKALSKQRMQDTITPVPGFLAEHFPFPVCLDSLDFIFENDINQYKNNKKPIIDAVNITEKIGKTYETTSIEQWRSFSMPAQKMAWIGFKPETILGTALYTSENTYVQSIADMISERMEIKPEIITSLQDYNPFTNNKTNERLHKKQCNDLIGSIINKIRNGESHKILLEIAKKQNQSLLEKSPIGWCASALLIAADTIEQNNNQITEELFNNIKKEFDKEVSSIAWDTLTHFLNTIFMQRRNKIAVNMSDIIKITESNDEFMSIHRAISEVEEKLKESQKSEQKNITDFISINAIKK